MKTKQRLPVEDIKRAVNILDLVGETVSLRKTGRAYQGMCPFHNNERTPAFAVFPDNGTWYCFGACGRGGDVISFVMQRDNLPFQEAVRVLAARAGIALPEDAPDLLRRYELLKAAASIYHDLLMDKNNIHILQYMTTGRGIAEKSISDFNVGLSYSAGQCLVDALLKQGFSVDECIASGVAYFSKEGYLYDLFQDRIMFPICDPQGHVLGFGGRAVRMGQQPKFLNSHNNDIFDKSACLFGIDHAWQSIRKTNCALLVEGYFDVIACHQMGFDNTVAVMGTSLSEDQVRILKQYTKNITMVMDGDEAGEKAVRQLLSDSKIGSLLEDKPQFDAGSVVRSERKFGVNISVATLPPGKDPDELNMIDLFHVLDFNQPLIGWLIARVSKDIKPDDGARSKADKINVLAKVISLVPDVIERVELIREVSQRFQIDYRAIKETVDKCTAKPVQVLPVTLDTNDPLAMEAAFMKSVISAEDSLNYLNRNLRHAGLEVVKAEDFTDAVYGEIIRVILLALEQWEMPLRDFIEKNFPEALLGMITIPAYAEFLDPVYCCAYQIEIICGLRIAAINRAIEAVVHSELSSEEKQGKITEYVSSKRIIEQALKSLKEKAKHGFRSQNEQNS